MTFACQVLKKRNKERKKQKHEKGKRQKEYVIETRKSVSLSLSLLGRKRKEKQGGKNFWKKYRFFPRDTEWTESLFSPPSFLYPIFSPSLLPLSYFLSFSSFSILFSLLLFLLYPIFSPSLSLSRSIYFRVRWSLEKVERKKFKSHANVSTTESQSASETQRSYGCRFLMSWILSWKRERERKKKRKYEEREKKRNNLKREKKLTLGEETLT